MGEFRKDRRSGRSNDFDRSERSGGSRDFGRSRDRSGSGSRDFGRGDKEMHKVICDKCGKDCMVPFKPTTSKPVYCSDCFREKENSRESSGSSNYRNNSSNSDEALEQINRKLDKLSLIHI